MTEENKTETEEQKPEINQEVTDAHTDFDNRVKNEGVEETVEEEIKDNSDDKNSADDKGSDDTGSEEQENADDKNSSTTEDEPKDAINTDLLVRAAKAGLSPEQIDSYSTSKDLESTVSILEERQDSSKSEETEQEVEPEKFDCGLDPEVYDQSYIDAMNKMGQKITDKITEQAKTIDTLKSQNEQFAQASESKAADDYTKWLDSKFNDLGENFEDVFGKGDVFAVKDNRQALEARKAVDDQIGVLVAGYQTSKKQIPPQDELFDMAIQILHKDKLEKSVSKKEKLKDRSKQSIGPGSSTGDKNLTGNDKALNANREFDAKLDDD